MSRLVITGGTLLDQSGERPGSIAVVDGRIAVSYTHLTLPTSDLV